MRWFVLLLLLVLVPSALAANDAINVTITETGKITSYLNTYWVVNVEGTGVVNNPSEQDLFDVRLFYDIIGLTLIPRQGDGQFDETSLYFRRIPAQGSSTFSYQIIGIVAQPPTLADKGVLYTGFAKRTPRVYSDVFGELQKAPLEDPDITDRNARLISVTFENPSSLQYTIESLRVLKTPELNPNTILDEWNIINSTSPRRLSANGFFVHDFLDYNAVEGEVYWLQSDIFISRVILTDNNNLTRFTEENLTIPIEELNFTNESINSTATLLSSEYLLRKSISDTLAVPGEPVLVTLQLYNFQPNLKPFTLSDTLPAGFSTSSDLRWSGEVPARDSVVLTYPAVLDNTVLAGIDRYPSATALIEGQTIQSNEVPFIRQYASQQNVYVQKRVSYLSDDLSSVEISVRNLGENPLSNITLKEFLADSAEFSQLSQQPESKGVWSIVTLDAGETWEVQYVTDSGDSVQTLPAVYGVDSEGVLRTLILENIVNEAWNFIRTRGVEIIGILVLIGAPAILLLSRKFGWFARP